jgi:hypothetical protein
MRSKEEGDTCGFVRLYSKYSWALTFQNFCQAGWRCTRSRDAQWEGCGGRGGSRDAVKEERAETEETEEREREIQGLGQGQGQGQGVWEGGVGGG